MVGTNGSMVRLGYGPLLIRFHSESFCKQAKRHHEMEGSHHGQAMLHTILARADDSSDYGIGAMSGWDGSFTARQYNTPFGARQICRSA
jgi:hypothetical protein